MFPPAIKETSYFGGVLQRSRHELLQDSFVLMDREELGSLNLQGEIQSTCRLYSCTKTGLPVHFYIFDVLYYTGTECTFCLIMFGCSWRRAGGSLPATPVEKRRHSGKTCCCFSFVPTGTSCSTSQTPV